MVLGSRRRAITLTASALAAVAFATAVAGRGCGVDDASPEGTARAFAAAVRANDREAILALLGPETRARLAWATKRATDLVGGGKRFDEQDLIGLASTDNFVVDEIDVEGKLPAESTGAARDYTVVELVDSAGQRATLYLVEVDGAWRIEVPAFLAGAPDRPDADSSTR